MDTKPKRSGLNGVGDLSWGTHFCLFYETPQDLLDVLAIYFNSGLANHEFCLWLTSDSSVDEAERALKHVIPSADQHLQAGDIEIASCQQLYCPDDVFDAEKILNSFDLTITQALEKGYGRVRVLCDNAWLKQEHWEAFSDFERRIDALFAGKPISILCAYADAYHTVSNIFDVARTHHFIAVKRFGQWDLLESPELKHAKMETERVDGNNEARGDDRTFEERVQERTAELRLKNQALQEEIIERRRSEEALFVSESRLQAAIDASGIGLWDWDLLSGQITWLGHHEQLFGFAPGEFDGTFANFEKFVHPHDLPELNRAIQYARDERTEYAHEYRVIWPDGSIHWRRSQGKFIYSEHGKPTRMYGIVFDITERKHAEEALRESEERFSKAFHANPIPATIVRLSDGWVVDVNQAYLDLSGYQRDEVVGRSSLTLNSYVDPEVRAGFLRKISNGEPVRNAEARFHTKEGKILDGLVSMELIEVANDTCVLATALDITEHKKSEAALRESQQLLQLVLATLPVGVSVIDQEGNTILVNEALKRIWGGSITSGRERWAQTKGYWHASGEPIEPENWASVRALSAGQTSLNELIDIETYDAQWKTIHNSVAPIRNAEERIVGAVIVNEDVSEQVRMENALRESEAKLKEAQRVAHVGYWELDLATENITWSDETYRMFGLSIQDRDLTLTRVLEHIHPQDRQTVIEAVNQAMLRGARYDMEGRLIRPDGETRIFHAVGDVTRDNTGQPQRMFGIAQDITERKQAEEEIQRYADRMEVLAELSHTFVATGLDYEGVLNTVARRTAELIGDACVIMLYSEDGQRSFPVAFYHHDPKARVVMQEAFSHTWKGIKNVQLHQRIFSGNSVFLPLVNPVEFRNMLEPEFLPYVNAIGVSGLIIVPLRVDSQVIGSLYVTRDQQGPPYSSRDQALLQDVADRAALTIQKARLFEQVQAGRRRLQALSGQLLIAQEEERRSIARELHDEIGQMLSGLMMQLGMARSHLPKSAKSAQTILEGAEALIQDILERTRAIIAGLRPQVLDDLGLVPAVRRLANEFQEDTKTQIEMKTDHIPNRLPAPLELALYRILQEGLTNVRKHAQAHRVGIALAADWRSGEDGQVILTIRDDGRGFEKQITGSLVSGDVILEDGWRIPEGHFGLIGIQERVAQLGGRLQVTSAPGHGTTLRVELPLSEEKVG